MIKKLSFIHISTGFSPVFNILWVMSFISIRSVFYGVVAGLLPQYSVDFFDYYSCLHLCKQDGQG